MIGIINYGLGNLASVQNAFDFLNIKCEICDSNSNLNKYDKIVLPGVGAFGNGMENLVSLGLAEQIYEFTLVKKKPILGLCLGMQLLLESSTEFGFHLGLGLVKGKVIPLSERIDSLLTVPHIGWNEVILKRDSILIGDKLTKHSYYFVHSYFCELDNKSFSTGITHYGIPFTSIFECENIFGCQFHPEKSQVDGLSLLLNFSKI